MAADSLSNMTTDSMDPSPSTVLINEQLNDKEKKKCSKKKEISKKYLSEKKNQREKNGKLKNVCETTYGASDNDSILPQKLKKSFTVFWSAVGEMLLTKTPTTKETMNKNNFSFFFFQTKIPFGIIVLSLIFLCFNLGFI